MSSRLCSARASDRPARIRGIFCRGFAVTLVAAGLILASLAPAVAKYAAIVTDAATGAVLYEDHADAPRYPASLTKMMTIYLLFEAIDSNKIKFTTRFPISERAAGQAPTKLGLEAGDSISVRDIILGLITKSANDAAVVAAEGLGGTEQHFAEIMTERAHKLGMEDTTFRNASGLPNPHQKTTARDLAILARALIKDFPQYYHLFSTTEFTYNGRVHTSHNRLNNWYPGADGIKTGYIRASGFNLVTSAIHGKRRLIGVVLGGISPRSRDQEMARLLDAAFARPPGSEPVIREAHATPSTSKTKKKAVKVAQATSKSTRALAAPITTKTESSGNWAIQVGAFTQSEPARRAAERAAKLAPRQLNSATVQLAPLHRKKDSVYRARLVGLSEGDARQACRLLKRHKMDCMPVAPTDIQSAAASLAASS